MTGKNLWGQRQCWRERTSPHRGLHSASGVKGAPCPLAAHKEPGVPGTIGGGHREVLAPGPFEVPHQLSRPWNVGLGWFGISGPQCQARPCFLSVKGRVCLPPWVLGAFPGLHVQTPGPALWWWGPPPHPHRCAMHPSLSQASVQVLDSSRRLGLRAGLCTAHSRGWTGPPNQAWGRCTLELPYEHVSIVDAESVSTEGEPRGDHRPPRAC